MFLNGIYIERRSNFLFQNHYGNVKIAQIGFQPRILESLASRFEIRVLDMDQDNIGSRKHGAVIESAEATESVVAWADLFSILIYFLCLTIWSCSAAWRVSAARKAQCSSSLGRRPSLARTQ